jgi:hypothetical protein
MRVKKHVDNLTSEGHFVDTRTSGDFKVVKGERAEIPGRKF